MKQTTLLNICLISLLSTSFACQANQEKEKQNLTLTFNQYKQQAPDLLNLDMIYQIPRKTYDYLDNVFISFYRKVTFNTAITKSTFKNSAHYELIAIPLIAENEKGLQFEIFGNFTDPVTDRLTNVSKDQALSSYYSNTEQLDIYQSQLSLGAGFSFNSSKNSKIKVLISNNNMPGYGKSKALIGFETSF